MVLPLEGLRVVEMGHAVAGPFASALLGDFGAEVIKVERPGGGDALRDTGPEKDGTYLWWSVAGRNKKSVTLDVKSDKGHRLLRELLRRSEVFVENFRPGVMERLNLGWERLQRLNPELVMLRISGFGQEGPYGERPGFGKIAEAFSGATAITGHRDDPPVHPGYSLGDLTSGVFGAFGVLLALYARAAKDQPGQEIDLALYEPLFRMIEWQIPMLQHTGESPLRNGNQFPFGGSFLVNAFETADGGHVVVSAGTEAVIRNLACFLNTVSDQRFEPEQARDRIGALERALASWIVDHPRRKVLERLEEAGVVCGGVKTAADLWDDEHVRSRGNLRSVDHPELGTVDIPAPVPRFSGLQSRVSHVGPGLGDDTEKVLEEVCGLSQPEIAALEEKGVI